MTATAFALLQARPAEPELPDQSVYDPAAQLSRGRDGRPLTGDLRAYATKTRSTAGSRTHVDDTDDPH